MFWYPVGYRLVHPQGCRWDSRVFCYPMGYHLVHPNNCWWDSGVFCYPVGYCPVHPPGAVGSAVGQAGGARNRSAVGKRNPLPEGEPQTPLLESQAGVRRDPWWGSGQLGGFGRAGYPQEHPPVARQPLPDAAPQLTGDACRCGHIWQKKEVWRSSSHLLQYPLD